MAQHQMTLSSIQDLPMTTRPEVFIGPHDHGPASLWRRQRTQVGKSLPSPGKWSFMGQDGEVWCPSGVLLWGLVRSLVRQGASVPPPLKLPVLAQPVLAPNVVFPQQPPVLPGLRVQLLQLLGGAHIHLEQPSGV